MNVVLLAAGLGTRLQPLTLSVPKCLVPIHGKPLLDYWLELLLPLPEIDNIYINLHYRAEDFNSHLQRKWSQHKKIQTWYEPELLGTAGTLREKNTVLQGKDCLVIHADNLSWFDIKAFIATHNKTADDVTMTMMLFHTDQPKQSGIVELDEQLRVMDMHEKQENPPGNLANAAVYILKPALINKIYSERLSDISLHLIPTQLGHIQGWLNTGYHRDIGTPESYQKALEEFPESADSLMY